MRGGRQVAGARPQLAALTAWLRGGMDRVGRGRRGAVARRAGWSVSSVGAAVAGRVVPSWELTEALALVCGLDAAVTARLWRAARAEREGWRGAADPDTAGTAAEFVCGLRVLLLAEAGLVGVRAIAAGSGLSRSAAGRVLKGAAVPAAGVLEMLLAPCRLGYVEHERWLAARDRLAGVTVAADEHGTGQRGTAEHAGQLVKDQAGEQREPVGGGGVWPPLAVVPRLAEVDAEVGAGAAAVAPAPGATRPRDADGAGAGAVPRAGGGRGQAAARGSSGRGSQYLDAAVLAVWVARELRGLHAGFGVHRVGLEVGRTLGEVCGVDLDAPAHAQRQRLMAALVTAAGELPSGVAWPALVAFNIAGAAVPGSTEERGGAAAAGGEPWGPFWSTFAGRVGFLAEKMARDPRTVRRYVTQAEKRLAEVLVSRYVQARDPADGRAEEHVDDRVDQDADPDAVSRLVDGVRVGGGVGVLAGTVAGADLRGREIDASAARSATS